MKRRTRSWIEHWTGTDSSTRQPATIVCAGVAVLLSTLVSLVGYGLLPAEMRIHWTLGSGPYYGPEFAPTAVVLALFPVLIGVVSLGGAVLGAQLPLEDEPRTARLAYAAAFLGVLLALLGTQVGIVAANL